MATTHTPIDQQPTTRHAGAVAALDAAPTATRSEAPALRPRSARRGALRHLALVATAALVAIPGAASEPAGDAGQAPVEAVSQPLDLQDLQEGRDADHEALRALLDRVEDAVNRQDAEALADCLTEQFVLTTADQRVITTRDGLDAYYRELFVGADAPVTKMSAQIEASVRTWFIDQSTGVCHGTSTEHYDLAGGASGDLVSHWTAVCVKTDGRWLVAAVHAGVDFMDNPVLDHIKRRSVMLATAASVVALLVGALISLVVFRRSPRASGDAD